MKSKVPTKSVSRRANVDTGWSYMVAVASFVSNFLAGAIYFGSSVLTPVWIKEFSTTSAMTSLVGSAAGGFISGVAPISSYLCNKFDHRKTHMFGGIIASVGLFLTSFATNLTQIFIFYGFFGGLGIGMCYIPAIIIMRQYFDKKYAIFMGVITSAVGVGSCVFPVVIEKLERVYGWRGAVLILSGVMGNMCVSASIMLPVDNTEDHHVSERNKLKETSENTVNKENITKTASTKEKESFWNLTRKTLSNPYFFVGAVSNFTFFFSQMVVIALTPMRAQFEYKMTPEQGAILASSIGLSIMLSRFVWGALCNASKKVDPFKLYCLLRLVTSAVTLFSAMATSFSSQLVCCVILGAGFGSWSLVPIFLSKMFSSQLVDTAYGYLEVMNGIGCLVGPFIGGLIYDVTKSFRFSFMMSGITLLVGTVVIYVTSFCIERSRTRAINLNKEDI